MSISRLLNPQKPCRVRSLIKSNECDILISHLGPGDLLVSAAVTPAPGTESDFDDWYRQEHTSKISECPGYVRTRRYKLHFTWQGVKETSEKTIPNPPSFLALHEFTGEKLPLQELQATAETEWGKRTMEGSINQEFGLYRLLQAFGVDKKQF